MSHIDTISEFLLHAGTDYRIFDMARGIRPVESQQFLDIENAHLPAPYPRQQHAWFGILFFNASQSHEHYIWFVKLPLDEKGLVIAAGRQQFLQIVVEALGQSLDNKNNPNNQLPDNPFTFVPGQQQLADFNSSCRLSLDLPFSSHFALAREYIETPEQSSWKNIPVQGIADFAASLQQTSCKKSLMQHYSKLADEMKFALCASLENHRLDLDIGRLLIEDWQQDQANEKKLHAILRGLSQCSMDDELTSFLLTVLNSEHGNSASVLILIGARHWSTLKNQGLLTTFMELLANTDNDTFVGLYSDLVQIPEIRDVMLNVLRWPQKSPQLTLAIGHLFGQKSL